MGPETNIGTVEDMQINLHGTAVLPNHMKHGARNYNHDYNRVHNRVGKAEIKYKERDIDAFLFDLAKGDTEDYLNKY